MVPPVAIAKDIWDSSSGEGLREPRVAAMPPATPIMPKAFPRRLVPWADRPASAPTQHKPDPRYIIYSHDNHKSALFVQPLITVSLTALHPNFRPSITHDIGKKTNKC